MVAPHYDVAVIGAGLAGLSFVRQLLLTADKKVLLLDKRSQVPGARQKVGESTVQVGGYYLSKVLDLQEHLLREHYLKYNLRFYWKNPERENRCFEDYSQCYIRPVSNIAGYQVDRNKLEAEMLRLNREHPGCTFHAPAADLEVSLSEQGAEQGPHSLRYKTGGHKVAATAGWVVDTTGRGKFLTRRLGLARPNPIRHGSSFLWVDGLVDVEKLTDLSPAQVRVKRDRDMLGHLPLWLATNHFVGEGFWFWIIPLQGKTSLGLVYDKQLFDGEQVSTPRKLMDWVCREFPLFVRDLPHRKVLDHGMFKDFSYDCAQTLSESRWALSGEAGRFSDPLYSPGTDLIGLHNTLIIDAMLGKQSELAAKVPLYETLMRSLYEAYVPSYAVSYDVLGDAEAFTLKYCWELTIYFAFYVFPFINDLFTNRRFIRPYLSKLSRLGPINRNLQTFISAYYQWKKTERQPAQEQVLFDFMKVPSLRAAESTFYRVGLSADEALDVLDAQLANLKELARFIVAHVGSMVLADESLLTNRAFIESIDLSKVRFDPDELRSAYPRFARNTEKYEWTFDPCALRPFRPESRCEPAMETALQTITRG
jgi:flavin-dependent dehydrogenase